MIKSRVSEKSLSVKVIQTISQLLAFWLYFTNILQVFSETSLMNKFFFESVHFKASSLRTASIKAYADALIITI